MGIMAMAVLGYASAVYLQDLVWLIVPMLVIVIAAYSMRRIFKK
jgi:hypothetical protein